MTFKIKINSFKYVIISTLFIFILGSLTHFLYDFTKENTLIALFSPVNESVFEHCKMVLLPTVLWGLGYFNFYKKKDDIIKDKYYTSINISLIVSIVLIPLLFYFYTGAFGVEIIAVDVLILFISVLIGNIISVHFYVRSSKYLSFKLNLIITILIFLLFILGTFYPPEFPIFMDSQTNTYGI